ncbi:MAG: hypothetical protein Aurels2KO_39900 [Aureliella sp.]
MLSAGIETGFERKLHSMSQIALGLLMVGKIAAIEFSHRLSITASVPNADLARTLARESPTLLERVLGHRLLNIGGLFSGQFAYQPRFALSRFWEASKDDELQFRLVTFDVDLVFSRSVQTLTWRLD